MINCLRVGAQIPLQKKRSCGHEPTPSCDPDGRRLLGNFVRRLGDRLFDRAPFAAFLSVLQLFADEAFGVRGDGPADRKSVV